jgi:ribosomal protein L1
VEIFQKYGYDTLNEVCKLNAPQLMKMGVNQMDTEKILENVGVLRQTLQSKNEKQQEPVCLC